MLRKRRQLNQVLTMSQQVNRFAAQDELCNQMRSFGVVLNLVRADRGFVLEGISPTYYGKQMAQELARKARFVVVANHIRVDRMVATTSETAFA
jgi:hypothetical protein